MPCLKPWRTHPKRILRKSIPSALHRHHDELVHSLFSLFFGHGWVRCDRNVVLGRIIGPGRGYEQARDNNFHSAQAVFLVDSDCLPSESLLNELHSEEVQSRINSKDRPKTRSGSKLPVSHPAAVVVPCLEFAPGSAASRAKKVRFSIRCRHERRLQSEEVRQRRVRSSIPSIFGELVKNHEELLLRIYLASTRH